MPAPDSHISKDIREVSLEQVIAPIKASLDQTRCKVEQILRSGYSLLDDCVQQVTNRSGKMLRPAVLLLSGASCGTINSLHIDLAAIQEIIHAATLLHDDVIDRANLRRGQPSANAHWGNVTAVLMGDYLLGRALKTGAHLQNSKMVQLMTEAADTVCRGELLQNLRKADWQLTEEEYLDIIDMKTASLFRCCGYLGAMASNAQQEQTASLGHCAGLLGQVFQVSDDLLDILGSEGKAGKTLGTDLSGRKPTLPVIYWLQSLNDNYREGVLEKINRDPDWTWIQQQIQQSSCIGQIRQKMKDLAQQAITALEPIPEGDAKNAMALLAQYVAHRI